MSDLAALQGSAVTDCDLGEPLAWSKRALQAWAQFGLPQELARQFSAQPRARTVVREASKTLVAAVDEAKNASQAPRRLLVGEPGCGKSTYLLQAVAHAIETQWAVLYVPRAIQWINSSSPYSYHARHGTYLQPELATALLKSLLDVNGALLRKVRAPALDADELQIAADTPLDQVLKTALKDDVGALSRQLVLEHAIATLAGQKEIPFLVAIDDVQALFGPSKYRDPDFALLEAFELAVPRALLQLAVAPPEGQGLQRGIVLATMSSSHAEYPPPPALLAALRESTQADDAPMSWKQVYATVDHLRAATRVPQPNAYTTLQDTHLANAKAASFVPLNVGARLQRAEAASLVQLLQRERSIWAGTFAMLTPEPNDEVFLAKLVESSGNMHVFARSWQKSLM